MPIIDKFAGQHAFLSNFYPVLLDYNGLTYASVEHAFQAAKTVDSKLARLFSVEASIQMTATQAKRAGRKLPLRGDWNSGAREQIMLELVRLKFEQPGLRLSLIRTGHDRLIEGNWWHDTFWGVCTGCNRSKHTDPIGENKLGLTLERVRYEIVASRSNVR